MKRVLTILGLILFASILYYIATNTVGPLSGRILNPDKLPPGCSVDLWKLRSEYQIFEIKSKWDRNFELYGDPCLVSGAGRSEEGKFCAVVFSFGSGGDYCWPKEPLQKSTDDSGGGNADATNDKDAKTVPEIPFPVPQFMDLGLEKLFEKDIPADPDKALDSLSKSMGDVAEKMQSAEMYDFEKAAKQVEEAINRGFPPATGDIRMVNDHVQEEEVEIESGGVEEVNDPDYDLGELLLKIYESGKKILYKGNAFYTWKKFYADLGAKVNVKGADETWFQKAFPYFSKYKASAPADRVVVLALFGELPPGVSEGTPIQGGTSSSGLQSYSLKKIMYTKDGEIFTWVQFYSAMRIITAEKTQESSSDEKWFQDTYPDLPEYEVSDPADYDLVVKLYGSIPEGMTIREVPAYDKIKNFEESKPLYSRYGTEEIEVNDPDDQATSEYLESFGAAGVLVNKNGEQIFWKDFWPLVTKQAGIMDALTYGDFSIWMNEKYVGIVVPAEKSPVLSSQAKFFLGGKIPGDIFDVPESSLPYMALLKDLKPGAPKAETHGTAPQEDYSEILNDFSEFFASLGELTRLDLEEAEINRIQENVKNNPFFGALINNLISGKSAVKAESPFYDEPTLSEEEAKELQNFMQASMPMPQMNDVMGILTRYLDQMSKQDPVPSSNIPSSSGSSGSQDDDAWLTAEKKDASGCTQIQGVIIDDDPECQKPASFKTSAPIKKPTSIVKPKSNAKK